MFKSDSAKKLLTSYNHSQLNAFKASENKELKLLKPSKVPGIAAQGKHRFDVYTKDVMKPWHSRNRLEFIKKNDSCEGFVWKSSPENIKKATHWGIIRPESITGKVVATLGQYRVTAHERLLKGMQSNTQQAKLKLLDVFQERIEALEGLESLVNTACDYSEYQHAVQVYTQKITALKAKLSDLPEYVCDSGITHETVKRLDKELNKDIKKAYRYLFTLNSNAKDLNEAHHLARGEDSVLEFVKSRMLSAIYQLQGINQDMTYSRKRFFALTRGDMNDYIEDALHEISAHEPDLCNAVTTKHHGDYREINSHKHVCYDFCKDGLTPAQQRSALMAISFIEGWDKHENDRLINHENQSQHIDTIYATHWKTHRHFKAFLKTLGHYLVNFFKALFTKTQEHDVETWEDSDFHLYATQLRAKAQANPSIWRKPLEFFLNLGHAVIDLFSGIRDFGAHLAFRLPGELLNDWATTSALEDCPTLLEGIDETIQQMMDADKMTLDALFEQSEYTAPEIEVNSSLAEVDYHLTRGEYNDILCAASRGINEFGNVFSQTIYAKDPVAGLLFSLSIATGTGVMFNPALMTAVFGKAFTGAFTKMASSMGTSKLMAAISGGSTQGQALATAWDTALKGPNSMAANALYQIGKNPLEIPVYVGAAYLLGYVLANGVAGHGIPWLSNYLKEDLGKSPDLGYPFVGGKVAIMLYEALHIPKPYPVHIEAIDEQAYHALLNNLSEQEKEKLQLICWLSVQARFLHRLDVQDKLKIERLIDKHWDYSESRSLNKLLYPQTEPSIAYQVFYVPLSYIPALLRLTAASVMCLAALILNKAHPGAPLRRAGLALFEKLHYDLTRVYYFTSTALYIPYNLLVTHIKALASTLSMAGGRISGLFNWDLGQKSHKVFAKVHLFFRRLSEQLYPTQIIQTAHSAHPCHTLQQQSRSYDKMRDRLGRGEHRKPNNTIQHCLNLPDTPSNKESMEPEIIYELSSSFQNN